MILIEIRFSLELKGLSHLIRHIFIGNLQKYIEQKLFYFFMKPRSGEAHMLADPFCCPSNNRIKEIQPVQYKQ